MKAQLFIFHCFMRVQTRRAKLFKEGERKHGALVHMSGRFAIRQQWKEKASTEVSAITLGLISNSRA